MSDNVISLNKKREEKIQIKAENATPSAEVVKLWRLSLCIDDLIKAGVVEDKLPPEEIATILANRLGTLIRCCENAEDLSVFCREIIEKLNNNDAHDKGA